MRDSDHFLSRRPSNIAISHVSKQLRHPITKLITSSAIQAFPSLLTLFESSPTKPFLDLAGHRRRKQGSRSGTWRVQINVIPVPAAQARNLRSRLPHLPINTVLPLLSAAAPADLNGDDPDDSSRDVETAQKLDDQTFALLKSLQLQGTSGLALELISPQLDGIPDPNARLKFASILFDMMHIRGRYADAAELIRQELALYPPMPKYTHS